MIDFFNPKSGICFILILSSYFGFIDAKADNYGLKNKIDSLQYYSTTDTNRVNLLKSIAWEYRNTSYSDSKKYFHLAEVLAQRLHFQTAIINIYSSLGLICFNEGAYDSSIYFHLKSLKLRETIHDNAGIAHSNENLGNVYIRLNDSAKALYYLHKSVEFISKTGNILDEARINMDLGFLYQNYKRFDLARSYYLKALPLFIMVNNRENQAKIYSNIGATYFSEGNYKKALVYFSQNARMLKSLNNYSDLANAFDNIAIAYEKDNKDSSLYYFNLAIPLAKKTGSLSSLMEIYGNLSDFYKQINDYQKAYNTLDLYDKIKDSIYNIEKSKAIADMQTKYETEKKEQQIAILTKNHEIEEAHAQRQSFIGYTLGIGLILILIISFILYHRYRFERKAIQIIRAEKRRSDELLLNILPAETAQELIKYGKTTARNYDEVSVMFADIKGFTEIAESMTADALVEDLDKYFGSFDLIIERHGLEKIKTIGDAYLCAGGLTGSLKGTPIDIIKAALEMQQYVEAEKLEKLGKNQSYFEIRIGINTGPVVAGVVGIKKFAYDIWGDAVNTAARMEQFGETGKVNISEHTYYIVKDNFNCTSRGNIEVKSKGIIAMYFVDSEKIITV